MYRVTYREIAAQEYEEAIKWYQERSIGAAERFVNAVNKKLDGISRNPLQYKNSFKNFHEISTEKYPYTIVYIIDEEFERVVIVAIYHHKRRPQKKYRK